MDSRRDQIMYSMLAMWEEISRADPDGIMDLCHGWLKYALRYLHLEDWPPSIIKACLRRGPAKPMLRRDIRALLSFFIGNGLTYICSGHWVLIRIGVSKCKNKEREAKRAILCIIKSF